MLPEDFERFLSHPRWGSLGVEDEDGELSAYPVWIAADVSGHIRLEAGDPDLLAALAERSAPVCLVADEFETYEQIRGIIVRGLIRHDPEGSSLEPSSKIGFGFAGTLPPQLRATAGPTDDATA